jgi:hypothetical protein
MFILCGPDGVELGGLSAVSPDQLPPADEGQQWIEVSGHIRNWTTALVDGQCVPVPKEPTESALLAASKSRARETVNEMRGAREFSFFTWDGSTFDADAKSQARLQGAFQLANLALLSGQPFQIEWTLADNTVRQLSGPDMVSVGHALADHVLAAHRAAAILKAQIDAATTIAEVEAVAW